MKVILISKGFWNVSNPDFDNNETHLTETDQARALIIPALGEDQMSHVKECTMAHQAWKKVKMIFAGLSTANINRLYKKLFTLRLNDGDDV